MATFYWPLTPLPSSLWLYNRIRHSPEFLVFFSNKEQEFKFVGSIESAASIKQCARIKWHLRYNHPHRTNTVHATLYTTQFIVKSQPNRSMQCHVRPQIGMTLISGCAVWVNRRRPGFCRQLECFTKSELLRREKIISPAPPFLSSSLTRDGGSFRQYTYGHERLNVWGANSHDQCVFVFVIVPWAIQART